MWYIKSPFFIVRASTAKFDHLNTIASVLSMLNTPYIGQVNFCAISDFSFFLDYFFFTCTQKSLLLVHSWMFIFSLIVSVYKHSIVPLSFLTKRITFLTYALTITIQTTRHRSIYFLFWETSQKKVYFYLLVTKRWTRNVHWKGLFVVGIKCTIDIQIPVKLE